MNDRKVKCTECGWKGTQKEILTAPSPFDAGYILNGCPQCKWAEELVHACDEPDCWSDVSCGTPIKGGYKSTCSKHKPQSIDEDG